MENASKALIIAGAILISILLISVGVMVMNSASSVTDSASGQMNDAAIQAFNNKFINYQGPQKGSVIRQLESKVRSNNGSEPDHQVTYSGPTSIRNSATYTVTLTYSESGDDNGYITGITVTEGNTEGGTSGTGSTGGTGGTSSGS